MKAIHDLPIWSQVRPQYLQWELSLFHDRWKNIWFVRYNYPVGNYPKSKDEDVVLPDAILQFAVTLWFLFFDKSMMFCYDRVNNHVVMSLWHLLYSVVSWWGTYNLGCSWFPGISIARFIVGGIKLIIYNLVDWWSQWGSLYKLKLVFYLPFGVIRFRFGQSLNCLTES